MTPRARAPEHDARSNHPARNSMKTAKIVAPILALIPICLISGCNAHEEQPEPEEHTIVVTSPKVMDVVLTQPYVCQLHSRRHIEVCALETGYLEAIPVKEGQEVKEDQVMFSVKPI